MLGNAGMFLHYLDTNLKNIDKEEQLEIVKKYLEEHDLSGVDLAVKNDDFCSFLQELGEKECVVISANVVCLGTSLPQIAKTLKEAMLKNVTVITAFENLVFKPDKQTKTLLKGIETALEIRNSLVSVVTKKALAKRKAEGVVLGRRSRNKIHVLDNKEEEIILRRQRGESNAMIAKALGVSTPTLYMFYRAHPEIRDAGGRKR